MRQQILLVLTMGALAVSGAAAAQQPKGRSEKGAGHHVKVNPCAQYGAGFMKVPGSDTCVKVGGYVDVEGGVNVGR